MPEKYGRVKKVCQQTPGLPYPPRGPSTCSIHLPSDTCGGLISWSMHHLPGDTCGGLISWAMLHLPSDTCGGLISWAMLHLPSDTCGGLISWSMQWADGLDQSISPLTSLSTVLLALVSNIYCFNEATALGRAHSQQST